MKNWSFPSYLRDYTEDTNNDHLWDFVKCRIREETINYSIKRSRLSNTKEYELIQALTTQEELLASDSKNVNLDDYHKSKYEWKSLHQTKLKGSILWSKMKWVE